MSILSELEGAAEEVQVILGRDELATVCGRSVRVVTAGVTSNKNVADAGFFSNEQTQFYVIRADLNGFTVDTLRGQPILFNNRNMRITAVMDSGLHFALTCEGVNKG